jgi:REP element-mobilizing transposase RayT
VQGELDFSAPPGWGGKREGAGRKKSGGRPHRVRSHQESNPVHVTCKALGGVPNLRGFKLGPLIGRYFRRVLGRHEGFRIVVFSIQRTHLHMIVEADDQPALSHAMQGFLSGLARLVNRATGRSGPLWRERYHAEELTSPTQTRHAVRYVLQNTAKHGGAVGIDPLSSATWFEHWIEVAPATTGSPVARPTTWLLRDGWLVRGGPLSVHERPAIR